VRSDGRPVSVDVADGLVVEADEDRLRRALENMARNALVHGAGAITLGARDGELWVSDEGPPLPDDQLERLFGRFERGPDAGGRPGAGLGLAIVRDVAEAHGGSARLENAPGGGVRAVLTLPD
jgi:signal transduction histidine kinase